MNKKIKKLVLIIVSALLAVALLTFGTIKVISYVKNYVGDTTVYFENQTALSGDTVKLPLSITKNHGLWAGLLKVKYDTAGLEFVSCANGAVFDECEVEAGDGTVSIIVNMSELEDVKENGLVVTLNFKVKENAKKGDYNVQLNADTEFCDLNGEEKDVVLQKGTITVK